MSADDVKKWSGKGKPGMPVPRVPDDVRDPFILAKGIDWTASYIDPADWFPPSRTIVTYTSFAFDAIRTQASGICERLGVKVRDGGPRGPREMTPSGNYHREAA